MCICRHIITSVMTALALLVGVCLRADGQLPHLPSLPGGLSGHANAAAFAHYQALMMKLFDLNQNGILEPGELSSAKSGLGNLLNHHGGGHGGAAIGNGSGSLLSTFDQNGNGQLDLAELQMAQMMMAMVAGGNNMRPATGVMPWTQPVQMAQDDPQPPLAKKGKRKRPARVADFGKANKLPPIQKAPPPIKKKLKARAPMVEMDQPFGE